MAKKKSACFFGTSRVRSVGQFFGSKFSLLLRRSVRMAWPATKTCKKWLDFLSFRVCRSWLSLDSLALFVWLKLALRVLCPCVLETCCSCVVV